MGQLDGKVAWITGAGTGIGKAEAIALARDGASVVLTGRRKEPPEMLAAELKALGAVALVKSGDLTRSSVVLHCSRRICWTTKKAFDRTKVAKFASGEAQTAARLNTSRGFVTKYEANSRRLLCRY